MPNPTLADVLASYVPKLIQNRIATNPAPIESPVAEQLQAAVLFADISGFTLLTERLAERGPVGVETLARVLNEYFGQLIDIIHEYGGDVVKFAGDAVIAVWNIASDDPEAGSPTRADQWQWTMRAAECAIAIRKKLSNYKAEDSTLYLKLAVSVGDITSAHVGGVFNRWEFLLTGGPLVEVGIANNLANAGDVIITPSAWKLIRNDCVAEMLEFELKDNIAQGARLNTLNKPSSIFTQPTMPTIPSGAENSLRAYIPGAIINRLTAGQGGWIAELRRVTVLFVNLPEINQNTELEKAQNITRLIQRAIYRYEGSINKINVDDKGITIVAALGLPPFSHENDPTRGVQAALMIRKELTNLGVPSSIGIATGRIFCGSVGNDTRREYTTIGNAVNLSARLMGAAAKNDELTVRYTIPIICDRATYDSARDSIEWQTLLPQQVKGRSEAVEVFHPVEVKRSIIRPKTELIGRQEEKIVMANALQELARGTPHQTIIMQGEAGIGKSRLFEDLQRQAETLRVKTFSGGGDTIEKSTPYHAWRPVFHAIFNIEDRTAKAELDDDDRVVIQKRVLAKLSEIDPALTRLAPLLDVILPILIPENDLTSAMVGEIRANNTRELLTRLLQFEARHVPLLVVLEDLHWLDSASWALLIDIQQKVRPILLALNTRPLSDPVPTQFKQIADSTGTHLMRLDAMLLDDVESLVCQRLGVKSIPPMIGKLIREKSEGHPFFAEELAYAMREAGILVIDEQEARINEHITTLDDLSLPDTLQAAITNRIDSLTPSQQLALKVASVIGRIFTFRVLHAIHPIDDDKPSLLDYMGTLTRLSLTQVESEAPDLAYIFKHAVTQEVAYNLMLFAQRRHLHQAVAEWIEQNQEQNIESNYTLLAYHWSQAVEADAMRDKLALKKAVEYLAKSGNQAMQNYANNEAIQFFKQALEWDAKLPVSTDKQQAREHRLARARWHRNIGLAYYGLGILPECDKHARAALTELGRPMPESTLRFALGTLPQVIRQALHRFFPARYIGSAQGVDREILLEISRLQELMSRIYFYSNETLPIIYTVLRCLNAAERAGTSHELAIAYSNMSVLAGIAQLHPLAETYVERSLAETDKVNQSPTRITASVVISAYEISVGKWNPMRERAEAAKALCEQLGDYRQWGDCMALLGESAYIAGDYEYASNIERTLLENARRRRSPLHQCWALLGIARDQVRLGREAQAVPLLEDALDILEQTPNLSSSAETYGQLALAKMRLGHEDAARTHVEKVIQLVGNTSPTVYSMNIGFAAVAEVAFTLWEKALRTKPTLDSAKEQTLAESALKLVRAFQAVFPIGQPVTPYYEGWREMLLGKPEAALKHWSKGLEAAQKLNMPYEEALARLKLGTHSTDAAERQQHLTRAAQLFEVMGRVPELQMAKAELQKFK